MSAKVYITKTLETLHHEIADAPIVFHSQINGFYRNSTDDGAVFISFNIVDFSEIIQVGPIVYDNGSKWDEAYTIQDDRKTAIALMVEAVEWRQYDVEF